MLHFTPGGKVFTPEVQSIGKCVYLPILVISLGHAMRDKVNIETWTSALKELKASLTMAADWDEKSLRLLRFCYSRLKNDEVRCCFLFCAFFPEDYLFEPEELIRYWIAEEFIGCDKDMVTQIDEGIEMLTDLKGASMFDMFTIKGHELLKMHDLFRDLAISILKEVPGFIAKAGLSLKEQPYFWEMGHSRKISLVGNNIYTLEDIDYMCPDLTTLLLQDNPLTVVSPAFFSVMPAIQVLDISSSSIQELPSSLFQLTNLRLLFLQHCRNLKEIQSLEYLRQLRILSLRGSSIKELPQGMKELVNLRFFDLSETRRLENIQVGTLSSLYALQELHLQGCLFFTIESLVVTNCIKELRSLKHLQILTLSAVGFEEQLDTIMCLQEQSLARFDINVYGSTGDFIR